jgi:putative NADH-flavin reductase
MLLVLPLFVASLLNTFAEEINSKGFVKMNVAVVGATGGLGGEIVKAALKAGHQVTAIVRNRDKLSRFHSDVIKALRVIDLSDINPDVDSIAQILEGVYQLFSGYELEPTLLSGHQIVIEAISNSQRPHAIETLVHASEMARVPVFIACGGAGELFESLRPDALRVYETLPDSMSWIKEVSLIHLDVQEIVFRSQIPTVTQFCPPSMHPGHASNDIEVIGHMSAGLWKSTYEDIASTLVAHFHDIGQWDRKMMGFKRRRHSVLTVLGSDGTVLQEHKIGSNAAAEL